MGRRLTSLFKGVGWCAQVFCIKSSGLDVGMNLGWTCLCCP